MLGIVASCALGVDPCDDTGLMTSSVLPWWGIALVALGAIALVALGLAGLLRRAHRRRPWD